MPSRLSRRALLGFLVAATAGGLSVAATACGQTRSTPSGRSAAAARTPRFAGARNYDTRSRPQALGIADVNGDGAADVVTANDPDDNVSVFVNRGDGRLQSGRIYAAPESFSLAIADLNGDGKPDLAVGSDRLHRSGAIAVLLNRGDGSFGSAQRYTTGPPPNVVAVADLDGDGKRDLVAGNCGGNTVSVLRNRGDGTFAPQRTFPAGPGPCSIALGDLNGDGRPDLVSGDLRGPTDAFAESVAVLINNGDGSFAAPRSNRLPWHQFGTVKIADLDGDGRPDVVYGNNNGYVGVLHNEGGGTLGPLRKYRSGPSAVALAIRDLNGDGSPDVATIGPGDTWNYYKGPNFISVLTNRGDGSFRAAHEWDWGSRSDLRSWYDLAIGNLTSHHRPDVVAIGTLNYNDDNATHYVATVLANATGSCGVPVVGGDTVEAARRELARDHCAVGSIRRAHSRTVETGRVISTKPSAGAVLALSSKVALLVSR